MLELATLVGKELTQVSAVAAAAGGRGWEENWSLKIISKKGKKRRKMSKFIEDPNIKGTAI